MADRGSDPGDLARRIEIGVRTQIAWATFEPNGPQLWARVRREVGGFMQELFKQGVLQGQKQKDAYFVQCGTDTMTPSDIAQGNLIVVVGFAPLQPAEFVIFRIEQMTGQSDDSCIG